MRTPNSTDSEAVDATSSISERERSEIYAALYGLNHGIQQVLNSINFLDRPELGLPFLNGYRILADEIRSGINFTTAEAFSMLELRAYRERQEQRRQTALSTTDEMNTQKCE
jgi:hypothetical protein